MATAARDAAKASGFVVDNAEAWGDPARGCYGASLALTTKLGKPAKLAADFVKGVDAEGIAVTGLVTPDPKAAEGVLQFQFEKAPYRGELVATIGSNGHIAMLACFSNSREPETCDPACAKWLGLK